MSWHFLDRCLHRHKIEKKAQPQTPAPTNPPQEQNYFIHWKNDQVLSPFNSNTDKDLACRISESLRNWLDWWRYSIAKLEEPETFEKMPGHEQCSPEQVSVVRFRVTCSLPQEKVKMLLDLENYKFRHPLNINSDQSIDFQSIDTQKIYKDQEELTSHLLNGSIDVYNYHTQKWYCVRTIKNVGQLVAQVKKDNESYFRDMGFRRSNASQV